MDQHTIVSVVTGLIVIVATFVRMEVATKYTEKRLEKLEAKSEKDEELFRGLLQKLSESIEGMRIDSKELSTNMKHVLDTVAHMNKKIITLESKSYSEIVKRLVDLKDEELPNT